MHFEVIVLGAGINGLSTVYHLARLGVTSLALVEQFELGHRLGSSHGKSRITRSSYSSAKYVELIQVAHKEEWPRLSHDAGQALLTPTPGCFFGPGVGDYVDSLRAVADLSGMFEVLDPAEARRVFGMFRFPDSPQVVRDLTASVVAAEQTMTFLAENARCKATVLERTAVSRIGTEGPSIELVTSGGPITCDRLVVTAGGWVGRLLPQYAGRFQVAHQDVGYFDMPGAADFPVWVYCAQDTDSYYGLPSFDRPGAKVARHRTGKEGDNPDRPIADSMPEDVLRDLEEFSQAQFTQPGPLLGYEACLYTNTANEDFLLDHLPGESRVVVGSACSGHGFKFGPLTGRLLAELTLHGKTSLPLFEKHRQAFRWESHHNWE